MASLAAFSWGWGKMSSVLMTLKDFVLLSKPADLTSTWAVGVESSGTFTLSAVSDSSITWPWMPLKRTWGFLPSETEKSLPVMVMTWSAPPLSGERAVIWGTLKPRTISGARVTCLEVTETFGASPRPMSECMPTTRNAPGGTLGIS
ncbi:hypothetical protein D3C86_1315590 [compost metagenome]